MRGRLGGFFRLNPLLIGALAAVTGVAVIRISPATAAIILPGLAAVGVWSGGWRRGTFATACALLAAFGYWRSEGARTRATELLASQPRPALAGRLLADARSTEGGWSAPVRLASTPATVWWMGDGEPPGEGAEVSGTGKISLAERPRNPGEFDQPAWFEREGLSAKFAAEPGTTRVTTGRWADFTSSSRRFFRESITHGITGSEEASATILAVVMGRYPRGEDDLVEAYRNSGTLHAFSVSGMHVGLMGFIGWWALARLGVSRRTAVPLLITLIFGYAWISGNSPPAVRAAWMGAAFLGAFLFHRRPNLTNALGAVLLVTTLWNARLLLQPGVQLSYGIVAFLAFFGPPVTGVVHRFIRHDPYLPRQLLTPAQQARIRYGRKAGDCIAIAAVACVGSAPLTLWHFGMTTPVAVLAAIPMTLGLLGLMALSMLAAVLYPVSHEAAAIVNHGNAWVAGFCNGTARSLADRPYGTLRLAATEKPFLLVYDLDHGAGAACFASDSGTVLLDCGDRRSFRRSVLASLKAFGLQPDSIVLSHPDGGHVGGGAELLDAFRIRQVLLPVETARSPLYQTWLASASEGKITGIPAVTGESLPFPDDARLEILHAPDASSRNATADDRVAIFRLHWRGWKILFTSDAGLKTERRLLATGADISADVLIAGHHRSDHSLGDEFISAVAPRVIIASNPPYPPGEQLDPAKAAYWRGLGITVLDQRLTGGVTLRIDKDGRLHCDGFSDQSRFTLDPR